MLDQYVRQVRLLLSVLPDIARETVFALKGGTAINLFYRDMPRLSVDIDLTYLPAADRESSLEGIDDSLGRIMRAITGRNPRVKAQRIAGGGNNNTHIMVSDGWSIWPVRPILSSYPLAHRVRIRTPVNGRIARGSQSPGGKPIYRRTALMLSCARGSKVAPSTSRPT